MGRSRAGGTHATPEEDAANTASRSKRRRVTGPGDGLELAAIDGTRRGLYHCNYCQRDISTVIRIKCATCTDFDLCVHCFSVGAERHPHKASHPYHVMDPLTFPLLHPDWSADEEILLLEGVEAFGLGSWGQVAEQLNTKTPLQCFHHYTTAYMHSACAPLPDLSHLARKTKAELIATALSRGPTALQEGSATPGTSIKVEDDVVAEVPFTPDSVHSATLGSKEVEGEQSAAKGAEHAAKKVSGGNGGGLKKEGGQGGEGKEDGAPLPLLASEMGADVSAVRAFLEGAGEQVQSKRTIGAQQAKAGGSEPEAGAEPTGYNSFRNEFDPEYDNEAELALAEMEFKGDESPAEKELKVKMLRIYLARLEERKRRKQFILERGLLSAVDKRQNGGRKGKEERDLGARCRVFLRYHSTAEHEALILGLTAERRIRARIQELQEYRSAGCRNLAEGERYEAERRGRGAPLAVPTTKQRANRYHGRERVEGSGGGAAGGQREVEKLKCVGVVSSSAAVAEMVGKAGKKGAAPLDVQLHLGPELLSQMEFEVCSQYRLLPVQYLKMKQVLMEEERKAPVRREEAYDLLRVDPIKVDRVYDLFVHKGWIQGEGGGGAGGRRAGGKGRGKSAGGMDAVKSEGLGGRAGMLGVGEEQGTAGGLLGFQRKVEEASEKVPDYMDFDKPLA